MSFKKVDPKQSFPKMEEEILKFWEENKVFEKSVEKNANGKPFIFYEGPPTANGKPGLHHVLARAFKDIIPRYKTMKGFRAARKAGWDTHGLPVEIQVEKQLGLHSKPEIENIIPGDTRQSIIEFNKKCKESVWEFKYLWEKLTRRMGYWVNMEHPYVTYENEYMESVWWVVAQIFKTKNEKGESLIYKGHKVVPYCYRCGTALSSHEVAQGYQKVKDNSVYVKFKAKPNSEKGIDDNTYFLVWTTTPWTLPGNVALAVNPEINYVKVKRFTKSDEGKLGYETDILAESIYEDALNNDTHALHGLYDFARRDTDNNATVKANEVIQVKSNDLLNLEYETLYKTNTTDKKAYYVTAGDFVTTQDGTGIVHIAPAFGEDDSKVGKENNLPTILTVSIEGKIVEGLNIPGEGIPVKKKNDKNRYEVDNLIIKDLKEKKLFFREELYEHDYPFCWRCDTPLIYYAKPSWFIRMSELRDDLVKNNEHINWIPEHIKEGRFGEWLRDVKDWAISRERYWGTPIPIWVCQCGETKIIESIKELEELSGQKLGDLHKPFIDDIIFPCEKCGGEMKRTPEVLDVWFDSGSMPLAQFLYPNQATKEDKKKIESGEFFPADYICEAVDQTRGWFYTLHAIATLLRKAKKVPAGNAFRNVICLGHILDAKGKKMSKSRGNIVDSMDIMNEYGADMLRWMLYTVNQPGLPKRFDVKMMKDIMNRVFRMLWNSYSFFMMYASIDKFKPKKQKLSFGEFPRSLASAATSRNLLDRWIISELNILIANVDKKLEKYDVYSSAKEIEKFIDNLSNWYIRRSRKRFWKSEDDEDKKEAYQTLWTVLVEFSKLMAPFTPFIAEEMYRNLMQRHPEFISGSNSESREMLKQVQHDKECVSVHLADFPKANESLIDEKLSEEMEKTRVIITEALQLRAKAGIKVRQPLKELQVTGYRLQDEFVDIIREEANIKDVIFNEGEKQKIELNTEITEELKLEGQAREIIRFIQEMRKEAGYEVNNRIKVNYKGMKNLFENADLQKMIGREVLATKLSNEDVSQFDSEKELEIDGEKLKIKISK